MSVHDHAGAAEGSIKLMIIRFGMLFALMATWVWMAHGDTLGANGRTLTITGERIAAPLSLMVGYTLLILRSEGPWLMVWILNRIESGDFQKAGQIGFLSEGRSWACQQLREAIEMDEARRIRR
jgi:hypothetical protein